MQMQRITEKQLESLIEYINKLTNSPQEPYSRIDGKTSANIGNFHLYHAYGGVNMHRMSNNGGGVNTPVGGGTRTKRELYNELQSFIRGLEFTKYEAAA
jgi:hypothetical protein